MPFQDLLLKVPTIRKAWRAGHYQEIIQDDVSLVDMCEDLNICTKKLSLKISSTLIVGAARVYSAELNELYDDIIKLDMDFKTRNKRRTSDEDELSENPTISSTSQPDLASELPSTQPMSTLHSMSTTQSASTSEPASVSQTKSTTQPASTTEPKSSQSVSTSQSESTYQESFTSKSASSSQRVPISQSGPTSQPGLKSQSECSSPSRSTSQPLSSEESQKSECSTDHEDYFPLPPERPEQLHYEELSNYEDVSPTYTTSDYLYLLIRRGENRRREYYETSISSRRALSPITEENSSFYQRTDTFGFETSTGIDTTLPSNRSRTKRSRSDIRKTETTQNSEEESRKRQKSYISVDSSESGTFERTGVSNVTKERARHDDVSVRITKRTNEDSEYATHESSPSAQSIILQSSNTRSAEDQLESRKRKQTDTSEDQSSRLQKSRTLDVANEEISQIGSDFDKAFMRTTEASIEDTDIDERDKTPSEQRIVLVPSNTLKNEGLEREKGKKQDFEISRMKNTESQTDVLELGQRILLDAGTPKIRHQETQISPLRFKVLESRQDLLEAGTLLDERDIRDQGTQHSPLESNILESGHHLDEASIGFRNVRDQNTQVSPRHPNVKALGQHFEFDRNLPFVSVSVYGLCQCDTRVPCAILYSSITEE